MNNNIIIKEITNKIVIDLRARDWCKLKYPNHPKGCPNYNHKDICPPKIGLFKEYFNMNKPIYLVAVPFNLTEHANRMKEIHPNWSVKQCKCVLYWQGKVKKHLRITSVKRGYDLNLLTKILSLFGIYKHICIVTKKKK